MYLRVEEVLAYFEELPDDLQGFRHLASDLVDEFEDEMSELALKLALMQLREVTKTFEAAKSLVTH